MRFNLTKSGQAPPTAILNTQQESQRRGTQASNSAARQAGVRGRAALACHRPPMADCGPRWPSSGQFEPGCDRGKPVRSGPEPPKSTTRGRHRRGFVELHPPHPLEEWRVSLPPRRPHGARHIDASRLCSTCLCRRARPRCGPLGFFELRWMSLYGEGGRPRNMHVRGAARPTS